MSESWWKFWARNPEPRENIPDLGQLAIETLMAKGNPRAVGLAQEIERGRQRRTHGHTERDWVAECPFDTTDSEAFKSATVEDYAAWLTGYCARGGTPNSFHDYPMLRQDWWFVAKKGFTVGPLYGAKSKSIIVPAGVRVRGDDTGHNDLYFMDGFRSLGFHRGPAEVPVFTDVVLMLDRELQDMMADRLAERRAARESRDNAQRARRTRRAP